MTRLIVPAVFLAALNFYIAFSLNLKMQVIGGPGIAVSLFFLAFYGFQLMAPILDWMVAGDERKPSQERLIRNLIKWSYLALGVITSLFIYTMLADIVALPVRFLVSSDKQVLVDCTLLGLIGLVTIITVGTGMLNAGKVAVIRIDIPFKNLPESFDGFTIAQISDLHVGPTIRRDRAQNAVDIANALKPDMMALTGDFIDGTVEKLRDEVSPLAQLSAPYGKFYITGNHEYYWGASEWMEEFTRLGLHVLTNQHVVLNKGGDHITIAGVPDYSTRHMRSADNTNPAKSLEGAPQGSVKILLSHQPVTFAMAQEAGFDLQLSGHTHAGQYFPFTYLIRYFQKYYKGLNRYKNMWVYINRGTGYWGPPLRNGAPCEITLITLRREV